MYRIKFIRWLAIIAVMMLMVPAAAAQTDSPTPTTPPVVEVEGRIQAIDGTTLTIRDLDFDISEALIDDDVRLVVGEPVEVYARLTNGVLAAFIVDDEDDDDLLDERIEVTGIVGALDDTTLILGTLTFDITGATFDDTVSAGDWVEVYATLSDNAWVASRVELYDDDDSDDSRDDDRRRYDDDDSDDSRDDDRRWYDDDYDYELRGVLESIDGDTIIVSGQVIDASRADFDDDVAVGDLVEVEFYFINGELVALYVDDLDDLDDLDDDDYRVDDDDVSAGVTPTITASQAAAIALEVYPNATVTEIELYTWRGRLAWDVELSNRIDIYVDAMSGLRLEIDRPGDDDDDDDSSGWDSSDDSSDWDSSDWDSSDDSSDWDSSDYDDYDDDDYDDDDYDDDDYDDDDYDDDDYDDDDDD
ncbi:MAG: DUF5666 domain-containing protein [Chloroflexota bacterium]